MAEQRIFEVIYIRTTPARLWEALTDPDITERYWGNTRIESDWKVGSKVIYRRSGEVADEHTVLAVERNRRLVHTFRPLSAEFRDEPPSRVTLLISASGEVVRLTVIHEDFPPASKVFKACSEGWPAILSSLKTLLETGEPLPAQPFEPQAARFQRLEEYPAA